MVDEGFVTVGSKMLNTADVDSKYDTVFVLNFEL